MPMNVMIGTWMYSSIRTKAAALHACCALVLAGLLYPADAHVAAGAYTCRADVFRSQRPGHQESSSKRPVARTSHQTAVAFLAKAAVVGVLAFCTHSFDLPLPAKHFIYCKPHASQRVDMPVNKVASSLLGFFKCACQIDCCLLNPPDCTPGCNKQAVLIMTCTMLLHAAGFYVWLFTSMLLDGPAAACWRLIGLPLQVGGTAPLAHCPGSLHHVSTVCASQSMHCSSRSPAADVQPYTEGT